MNTKNPDVAKHNQEIPSPQAGLADREKESKEYVQSKEEKTKQLIAMRGQNKETLYGKWVKNNEKGENKEILDDPRYLALRDIPENLGEVKSEAVGLLHMYEKFLGTRKQALELYAKCWKGNKFDVSVLLEEFTREKTEGKTGFYFGTRTVDWDWGKWTTTGHMEERIGDFGMKYKTSGGVTTIAMKGWWSHDIDQNEARGGKVTIKGGYYIEKDLLKKLRGGGYGDEWLGKSFKDAMSNIKTELKPENVKTERDSGLTPRQEGEVLKEAENAKLLNSSVVYKDKEKENLYTSFSKQIPNKWVQLSEDMIGPMVFVFGNQTVNPKDYLYRYSPDKKRIYFIRIDGRSVNEGNFGGYIDIDDKAKTKTLKEWHALNQKDSEKEFKGLIDSMKDEAMVKELMDYGHNAAGINLLDRTIGMVVALPAFKKGISYDKLESDLFEPIRKNLNEKLEKEGITNKEIRDKYVEARVQEIKKQLEKEIEENSMIQEAKKENTAVRLSIDITNDKVKVDLADTASKDKYKKVLDDAKAKKDSAENQAKGIMDKILKKVPGPLKMLIVPLLGIFKFTEGIIDAKRGKPTFAATTATFIAKIFGIDLGARGKTLDQKGLDSIIPSGQKEAVLKGERALSADLKTNYKIVIPKGLGIQPGGKFKLKVGGIEVEVEKKEAKEMKPEDIKKKGFAVMAGAKDENVQFKDNEIVIEKGTVMPKDTILPKGAKFVKV